MSKTLLEQRQQIIKEAARPETLRDMVAEHVVGVQIGTLGHKLWVCVDGEAVLRVKAPAIEFTDLRVECAEGDLLGEALEACKVALAFFDAADAVPDDYDGDYEDDSRIAAIYGSEGLAATQQARAVLAKAKGEKP